MKAERLRLLLSIISVRAKVVMPAAKTVGVCGGQHCGMGGEEEIGERS